MGESESSEKGVGREENKYLFDVCEEDYGGGAVGRGGSVSFSSISPIALETVKRSGLGLWGVRKVPPFLIRESEDGLLANSSLAHKLSLNSSPSIQGYQIESTAIHQQVIWLGLKVLGALRGSGL